MSHDKINGSGFLAAAVDVPVRAPGEDSQALLWEVYNGYRPRGEKAVTAMIAMANYELDPGTVFEIRVMIPTHQGKNRGVAWYTSPEIQSKPEVPRRPITQAAANVELGFAFLCRLKAE